MMRFQSYFNTAILLIGQYTGQEPFASYLKKYFSQHKKHGSTDRKQIAQLCYCYFRIGYVLPLEPVEQRMKIALFLTQENPGSWGFLFSAQWVAHWNHKMTERIHFMQLQYPLFSSQTVFPWLDSVSEEMDKEQFVFSHLVQPDLFLRIRPGNEKQVLHKLDQQSIPFVLTGKSCLTLPNTSKIESVLSLDKEVVVQDYSSQRIAELLSLTSAGSSFQKTVWDCCAASGGKSILAKDLLQGIKLTVSDIRPGILKNLADRFSRAGITEYQSYIADLSQPLSSQTKQPEGGFELVICDAPCSGSGTWGRTPEQLCFFSTEKLKEYISLQRKIVQHIMPMVAAQGHLLYITCSVFIQENEEVVAFILENNQGMNLVKKELLKGYDRKADTLFAALFLKS